MANWFKRLWNDRRGNALLLAGAAMPLIIGSAGIATDTIQWVTTKRLLQRTADSAAIAGVYAKMQSQTVGSAVATDITTNNQTKLSLNTGYPVISYPADTSNYTNAVDVTVAVQKKLAMSYFFTGTTPVITANARAGIVQTGDYCVVSLEPSSATGIDATGNTSLNLGCGMITNSTSLSAAVATGSSSVTASPIAAVGGIQSSNNWAAGTQFLPFTVAQPDPFALVNATLSSCVPGGQLKVLPGNSLDLSGAASACYSSADIKGTLTLPTSTPLYINGGDMSVNAGAVITGTSSTIVFTNTSLSPTATIGSLSMNGNATVNLTAPTSGTFKGIAMYQDRRASSLNQSTFNGDGSTFLQGALYFPNQQLNFLGNAGASTNCVQMVARRVYFSGSSAINNTCPSGSGAGSFKGQHVRLVG